MFSKKSEIAFIGAGKIAYSLCSALLKADYNIITVISRNKSSAGRLAEKLRIPASSGDIKSLSQEVKIFFLTVPDSEIEKTARSLSKLNLDFKNSLFIHVSGALNINELKSLKKKKADTASFHIMQTFPSKEIVDIKDCPAAIETERKEAKEFLFKLASDLKLKPFYLEPDKKIYYHLAGVFASNFLAGNLFLTGKFFKQTTSEEKVFSIYEATLKSTLENIKSVGAAKALSGPVERGDYNTIVKHLEALKKNDRIVFANYIVQSLSLINVSKFKNRKLNDGQKRIRKLLMKELNQIKKL